MTTLPVDAVLPDLIAALRASGRAVLQAPPGAGKTSRVPLAIADASLAQGKIIMLEPRRLATRAAASRLAQSRNEEIGQSIGYRMRGDSKPGRQIEVVTEGILTRMIQSDPELSGISTLIFDEFHERSLHADLGLAMAWEVRQSLRPDLTLVVMSATLDAAPVAALLGEAPIVTSEGQSFPVTVHHLSRALGPKARRDLACADKIAEIAPQTMGGILAFLPGEGEIRRAAAALAGRLPADCQIQPLYGAMPFAAQRAAIAPAKSGRKVVLATSIAETSLTIPDIRVVVDAGLSRRARFDPGSGMSRLVTERVSRAEAAQRTGRAGRVAAGTAYRLWTKGEEGALAEFPPPEIEAADLAPLALELALWGSDALPFLTAPPDAALQGARALLTALGALENGSLTQHGRAIAGVPLHPRLAHMLLKSGADAASLAALMDARDPLRDAGVDVSIRLRALMGDAPARNPGETAALKAIRAEIPRLSRLAGSKGGLSPAQQAALAYPDRIAQRRAGEAPRYLMSGGKGAVLPEDDPLAQAKLLVITDLDGDAREARARQAIAISDAELRALYASRIGWQDVCRWSRRDARVLARRQECFGALVLDDRIWRDAPAEQVAAAMLDGVRQLGLQFSAKAERFRARVALVNGLPDMSDAALMSDLEGWLLPHLGGIRSASDWKGFDALPALRAMLDWPQTQQLDQEAPPDFTTPLGRKIPIDYSGETPEITLRLQEMFGQTTHPRVAGRPLRVTLLSPGQKPEQTTQDIPGFWQSSYADVRRDMRGRYPKHPWPEDPTQADPTLRAKPRSR